MEFIIIAANDSQRAAQFQQFLGNRGHRVLRIAAGQRVPAAAQCWLGAVRFEGGAELPSEVRESLRYLSIPLVDAPAISAESAIGPAATADAAILHELQSHCLIHPLPPDLQKQLAAPLVTAVEQTLSQMAGAEAVVQSMYACDAPAALGDLSVTLTLSHGLEGLLIVSFSLSTAEALARRIVADAAEELDPALVKDCVGEIANIVAGQAKALLHGTPYHFVFSTPTVTTGEQGITFKKGMTSLVIALACEQGPFALQLCRGG